MFRTMGEGTSVNPATRPLGRGKDRGNPRMVYLGIDVPLLLSVVTLLIIGLVFVYSASYDFSREWYGDPYAMIQRQVLFLAGGLVVVGILTFVDYHLWQRVAVPAMIATLGLLLLVLVIGEVRNSAIRTLLGGSVQPSELAKLITVIYLAVWLYSKRDSLSDISIGIIPLGVILGLVGGLIYLQPDVSAVLTILILGGTMFFLAGGDWRQILFLLLLGSLVGWGIVKLSATGSERIEMYWAGVLNPMDASYHVRRSLEAFVNGGWFGLGIGKAQTKLTGLPVPPTDSIFAVIGEETGFIGALVVIGLYVTLLWRALAVATRAPDGLGALLAGGLGVWVSLEAFINMSVMMNLLPVAGNALPFISAGGSNLIMSLVAVGILFNISRQTVQQKEENGRQFSAVVDLRRGDGGRGISRARRSRRNERAG